MYKCNECGNEWKDNYCPQCESTIEREPIGQQDRNTEYPKPKPLAAHHPEAPVAWRPGEETQTYSGELPARDMQMIANYRLMRKNLIPGGIGSIVFGVIAVVIGIRGMSDNPLNGILVLIGAFLTIEGICLVSAPKPGGLIADGFALLIVGVWNVFVSISNVSMGNSGGVPFFLIIGMSQLFWSSQSFGRYVRFSEMPQVEPTGDLVDWIDNIQQNMLKTTAQEDPYLVEFQGKTFTTKQAWKARLHGAEVVFAERSGQDLVFAKKEDVHFTKRGKRLTSQILKAEFRMGNRHLKGTISPEAFERYETWKAAMGPESTVDKQQYSEFDLICPYCETELTIDVEEINQGQYDCPECRRTVKLKIDG